MRGRGRRSRCWGAGTAAAAMVVAALSAPAFAASSPRVQLRATLRIPPVFAQGIARVPGGWIVSGTNSLARLDESLRVVHAVAPVIPPEWAAKGYDHVGDIDVVGRYVYAPFEQPDYAQGRQATARYDARTLAFVDAVELPQHENSFVTVDPRTGIAYTLDHFGGDHVLRYDVRHGWRRLPPLAMDRTIDRVQGGDVARGALWLSTDDAQHGIYRVALRSGHVDALGSAGHPGGEGEGIDATRVGSADLHVMTVDPSLVPVWLDQFAVVDDQPPTQPAVSTDGSTGTSTDWPPVLVVAAVVATVLVVGAVLVVFRRARRVTGSRRG